MDDPDFLLEFHLRRLRLSEPGSERQLLDLAQNVAMAPFDRFRPPWETTLVEGLEGGRAALIMKLHHVLADGIGIVQLMAHAASTTRASRGLPVGRAVRGRPRASAAVRWADLQHAPARASDALAAALESIAGLLRHPAGLQQARAYLASAGRSLTTRPADGSPILGHRSRNWRFDTIELPLAGLKAAAKGIDATVNDVFLAGLIGGLRRYHEQMGVRIEKMPIAFPISLRKATDTAGGNLFGAAQYAAPVGERDPVKRVAHVHAVVRQVRQEPALDVLARLSPPLVQLPPAVLGALAGRLSAALDAQISNVPGSDQPMVIAGAQVLRHWGFGPAPAPQKKPARAKARRKAE